MKKGKKILAMCLILALIAAIGAGILLSKNWPVRYSGEFDRFFGAGNWKCIDEETKKSMIYEEYIQVRSNPALSESVPGKYTNWYILFENRDQEEEIWYITDHTLKINHDRYGIFSPKRYTARQALTLEFMDIAVGMAGEEIMERVVKTILTEEEASCMEATVSYRGGNPKPEFYDMLAQEPWFQVNRVTAGDFLACEAHDFYISVRVHDYRLKKLTDEQREHVLNSMDGIVGKLCELYGEDASFWIYLDEEHKAEYAHGKPVA